MKPKNQVVKACNCINDLQALTQFGISPIGNHPLFRLCILHGTHSRVLSPHVPDLILTPQHPFLDLILKKHKVDVIYDHFTTQLIKVFILVFSVSIISMNDGNKRAISKNEAHLKQLSKIIAQLHRK